MDKKTKINIEQWDEAELIDWLAKASPEELRRAIGEDEKLLERVAGTVFDSVNEGLRFLRQYSSILDQGIVLLDNAFNDFDFEEMEDIIRHLERATSKVMSILSCFKFKHGKGKK